MPKSTCQTGSFTCPRLLGIRICWACIILCSRNKVHHQSWSIFASPKNMALGIDGLVQDCSNSSVLAMELLQSCTKPSILLFPIQNNIISSWRKVRYYKFMLAVLNYIIQSIKEIWNNWLTEIHRRKNVKLFSHTKPAHGMVLLEATPSAGPVMIEFGFRIYVQVTLKLISHQILVIQFFSCILSIYSIINQCLWYSSALTHNW